MSTLTDVAQWAEHNPIVTIGLSILAATASVLAALAIKSSVSKSKGETAERRKFSAGTLAAILAFIVTTSLSLNTSYGFTLDGFHMHNQFERIMSCAAYETLMAMCVLGARERLAGPDKSPGMFGSAVWILAALSAIPAWSEGGGWTSGTMGRIVFGSFGAAFSAHVALGLELRHRSGEKSQAAGAQVARELRERLMARLGLTVRDRSAQEIARDRALARAVDLADREARIPSDKRNGRKGRRLAVRLSRALEQAGTHEPAQRDQFLRRLAIRRQDLRTIELPDIWENTAEREAREDAAARAAMLQTYAHAVERIADEAEEAAATAAASVGNATAYGEPAAVPHQRADQEDAEALDDTDDALYCLLDGQDNEPATSGNAVGNAAAAAVRSPGNARLTVRVPANAEEPADGRAEEPADDPAEVDEHQDEAVRVRHLATHTSMKAAMQELYRRRIDPADTRSTNAIAAELEAVLREYTGGKGLTQPAAYRAVAEVRPAQPDTDAAGEARAELVSA